MEVNKNETTNQNKKFPKSKQKRGNLIHSGLDKAFKGTAVNQTCHRTLSM